jgi:hypothetical protein
MTDHLELVNGLPDGERANSPAPVRYRGLERWIARRLAALGPVPAGDG